MQFDNWLDIDTNPLYALLHEAIYCQVKVYFSDFFLCFSPFFYFSFFFCWGGEINFKIYEDIFSHRFTICTWNELVGFFYICLIYLLLMVRRVLHQGGLLTE